MHISYGLSALTEFPHFCPLFIFPPLIFHLLVSLLLFLFCFVLIFPRLLSWFLFRDSALSWGLAMGLWSPRQPLGSLPQVS